MREAPARIYFLLACLLLSACAGSGAATPSGTALNPNAPQRTQSQQHPRYEVLDANGAPIAGTHIMLTRDRATALAMAPNVASPLNLLYHAGSVENTPTIYLVFWGFRSDPSKEAARLTDFLKVAAGSAWLHTVWQYYSHAGGYIKNEPGELVGTWSDTSAVPSTPTFVQIQREAVRAAAHHGDYTSNVTYYIATPTGHDTSGFGTDFCAYHDSVVTSKGRIAYAVLPYITDAGAACGSYAVNYTSIGLVDGVSIVGGHELAESQTDPVPMTGWFDSEDEEIADKCAWTNLKNNAFSTGTYPTQPLWNNGTASCTQ